MVSPSVNPGGCRQLPGVLICRQAQGLHLKEPGASTDPFSPAQSWHAGEHRSRASQPRHPPASGASCTLQGVEQHPLVSVHQMPGTPTAPSHDNPRCPQTLPNARRGRTSRGEHPGAPIFNTSPPLHSGRSLPRPDPTPDIRMAFSRGSLFIIEMRC